jgi:predicted transcriptional regulator
VICLECGSIFKYLPGHLCKHNLSSEEYRAKWGYNRTTPLERLSLAGKKAQRSCDETRVTFPTLFCSKSH